jgi:hypothetical protein
VSNRQKKSGPRKDGPARKVLCVCGWRVLPEKMDAHRALGNCRIDLAAIERKHPGALMGCLLLEDATNEQWQAAKTALLVRFIPGSEDHESQHTRTDLGDRVLAALRSAMYSSSILPDSTIGRASQLLHDRERDQ